MSQKFHFNPASGATSPCHAKKRCSFGFLSDEHYSSKEEARAGYEKTMEELSLPPAYKRAPKKTAVDYNKVFTTEEKINYIHDKFDSADVGEYSYEEAQALSEEAFRNDFREMDKDTQNIIYGTAYDDTYGDGKTPEGQENWGRVFNEYEAKMRIVRAVRESSHRDNAKPVGDAGRSVSNSSNKTSAAASIFRNNRNISQEDGKEVLEACYPNALNSVDSKARKEIFDHAYSRGSSEGWATVAGHYADAVEIANRVKLSKKDRKNAQEVARKREFLEDYDNIVKSLSDSELRATAADTEMDFLYTKNPSPKYCINVEFMKMNSIVVIE